MMNFYSYMRVLSKLKVSLQTRHSQKSVTFCFEKSVQNLKKKSINQKKNLFSLLNLSQKYGKMLV